MSDGSIFAWGYNISSADGQPHNEDEEKPLTWPHKVETSVTKWRQISCSLDRTMGISDDGELYVWGMGYVGELGLGYQDFARRETLITKIPKGTKFLQVSCGLGFTLALSDAGEVWSWGSNEAGQLGQGHTKMLDRPTKIKTLNAITQIETGSRHAIALDEYGEIRTWGINYCGQLGRKHVADFSVPGKVSANVIFKSIVAGENCCGALSNRGEIYTWGGGAHGRLGHGNSEDMFEPKSIQAVKDISFFQISIGYNHGLALTETRIIYAWGAGIHGELGYGGRRRHFTPVVVPAPEKMSFVYASYEISFAISVTGNLYSWGNCEGGLLGNGRKVGNVLKPTMIDTEIEFRSISASKRHIIAIGSGIGEPPLDWNESDEDVDPNLTKNYADDDPERYLYTMYNPTTAEEQPVEEDNNQGSVSEEDVEM